MWPELQDRFGTSVQLIQVDRDSTEGRAFAESYRIYYQPAFVVIGAGGQVVRAALGPYGPDEVATLVENVAVTQP